MGLTHDFHQAGHRYQGGFLQRTQPAVAQARPGQRVRLPLLSTGCFVYEGKGICYFFSTAAIDASIISSARFSSSRVMVSAGVSVMMLPKVSLKLRPWDSAAYITASTSSVARSRVPGLCAYSGAKLPPIPFYCYH